MKIISIVNFKGGIAKTTSAIHLAAILALKGFKVLVLDFDPQTSLSIGYKITKENQYTILDLLEGKEGFRVTSKADNLHVLAGSKFLNSKVRDINILKTRLKQLNALSINNNQKPYDFVIIDCSPTSIKKLILEKEKGEKTHIPNLNEIALTASNYAMIPLHSEEYSIAGLKDVINDVMSLKDGFNSELDIAGVFFSMVMKNEKSFKSYYKEIKESIPEKYFFNTYIRKDKKIEESKTIGQSIFYKSPNANAALDYNDLCDELLKRIN